MLDIIYSLFQTIVHGISTIVNAVLSIPQYLGLVSNVIITLPSFIYIPLILAVSIAVIISIKRLVF